MSTINTTITHGVTLGTAGYTSPLTITSAGGISATGTAVYAGPTYANAALINSGTVIANATGVAFRDGGTITNSAGGFISGNKAIDIAGAPATVTNLGTIVGAQYGVYVGSGGLVVNSAGGLIAEHGAGIGAYAIVAYGGTVINFGSVSGAHVGIYIRDAAATVVNGGTISAGAGPAVDFSNFGNNRLVLYPGYSFGGGTIGVNVSTGDVLELGSGGAAGTVTGLNSEFAGFPTITVDSGGTWTLTGTNTLGAGVSLSDSGVLVNSGALVVGSGGSVTDYGTLTNAATLTVLSGGTVSDSGVVINRGTLLVSGGALLVDAATLVNSGHLYGAGNKYGPPSNYIYTAVTLGDGGYLLNAAGGRIIGHDGVLGSGTGVSLVNSGVIKAVFDGVKLLSGGEIDNAGDIRAIGLYGGGTIVNSAGGLIGGVYFNPPHGQIYALSVAATVTNAGTIIGYDYVVDLQAGGRVTNSAGGYISGNANDVFAGVITMAAPGTVVNFGTVSGGFGIRGIALQAGGTVVNGGTVNAPRAGAVYFGGGTGNNLLELYPGYKFGGRVSATGTANTLELASGGIAGTITNFATEFHGFSQLTVDGGAAWDLSGATTLATGLTVTVDGTLTALNNLTNQTTIGGTGLLVIDPATLANTGTIGIQVGLADGSYLSNAGTGLIDPAVFHGGAVYSEPATTVTVVNAGTTANANAQGDGVSLVGSGLVVNSAGGVISAAYLGVSIIGGILGSGGTLVNSGSIYGGINGVSVGTISNTGTIEGGFAVNFNAGGTLINSGKVLGVGFVGVAAFYGANITNSGGLISGYHGVGLGGGATLLNEAHGVVSGGAGAGAAGVLIQVRGGGTVTNEYNGLIKGPTGIVALPFYAIDIDVIDNAGTIAATGAGAGQAGIYIGNENHYSGIATVINSGTISAANGVAAYLGGYGARLEIDPGAVFDGIVNAGVGTGNQLYLGVGGNAVGTLSGLGGEYRNFQTITVGVASKWVLSGGNTVGAGVTLTDFNTLTNAGRLNVSAGTFIVDPATFINSGTVSGEVTLGGGSYLDNAGTISASGTAVFVSGGIATIVNDGTISAKFDAVYAQGAVSVINRGVMVHNDPAAFGRGILLISGGQISNSTTGTIAGYSGIGVDGGDTTLTNAGMIFGTSAQGYGVNFANPGGAGTVVNSGLIRGYNGVDLGPVNGVVITNSGTIAGTGGAGVRSGYFNIGGTIYAAQHITLINAGTIVGGNGTAVDLSSGGGNLLVLEHGYVFSGGVSLAGTANTLELLGTAGPVTVDFDKSGAGFTNFGTAGFGAASGHDEILEITDTTVLPGTITTFTQPHDIVDLTQFVNPALAIVNFDTLTDRLTVTEGAQSVSLQLDPNLDYTGVSWTPSPDSGTGTDIGAACYCRGTLIETPDGEVAVEDLRIGDLVMTLSGEARPVRWIGRRAYDGRFIAGNRQVLPIRVTAGALAENVPVRDLRVSPGHALYLDGVLVQAEHLVNGATIVQANEIDLVEYFHIELDTHEVIFADGAPAESYTDCDNRYMFANGAEYFERYPDDNRPIWDFCLRRLEWDDIELTELRAALLRRAASLGHEVETDPELHLVIDGESVFPVETSDGIYWFEIPAGAGSVLLASRSSVPAEVDAGSRDTRRLGVPVEKLVLYDADMRIDVGHRSAALADGFHGAEPSHRWTDGVGRLPEALLRPFAGPVTVELHLRPSVLTYRVPAAGEHADAA